MYVYSDQATAEQAAAAATGQLYAEQEANVVWVSRYDETAPVVSDRLRNCIGAAS